METKNKNQVSIVSDNPEVIAFCGEVIENMLFTKSYCDLTQQIIDSSSLVFIDGGIFSDVKNQKLIFENLKNNSRFIFIIPVLKFNPFCLRLYASMDHVFPYPCDINRVRKCYAQILIDSDRFDIYTAFTDYDIDSEEKLLRETFIGDSSKIKHLRSELIKAARNDGPVLLLGETGVGKTTAAKLIHRFSSRGEKEFVTKAATEFQDGLIDSALFGTEEGAYTGAKNKNGILRTADGGTFFLDEIGLASKELQGKLLLVIESGSFYSLGGQTSISSDVRMIFATNENLKKKIAEGTFKSDLYFRMEHNIIRFPSLRECREDIRRIASKTAEKFGKILSLEALRKLNEYDWPGNTRQLINYIKKACEDVKQDVINAKDIRLEY